MESRILRNPLFPEPRARVKPSLSSARDKRPSVLPAGEYRAAVDRGGAVRAYPFSVGTRNVALRLRP